MAQTETVRFILEADAQDLFDKLTKTGELSQKEARKLAKSMTKAARDAQRAVKKNAALSAAHWKRSSTSATEGFRKVASVAQGQFGRVTSAVLDGAEAFAAFGKAAGPVGIGLAAAAVAGVGAAVAIGVAAKGMLSLVKGAQELVANREKLDRLGGIVPIDASAIQAVRDTTTSFQRMSDAVDIVKFSVGAAIADGFGPMFDVLAAGLTDLARVTPALIDFALSTTETGRAIRAMNQDLLGAAEAWGLVSRSSANAIRFNRGLAESERVIQETIDKANEATKRLNAEVARKTKRYNEAAAAARQVASAESGLNAIISQTLFGTQKVEAAYQAQIAAIDELEKVSGNHALAQDARDSAQVARIQELASLELGRANEAARAHEQRVKFANEELDAEDARLARFRAIEEEVRAERKASTDAAVTSGQLALQALDDVAQAAISAAKDGSAAQKRAAMVAFVVSKAAALGQIAINTIVAASRAPAELGPIAGAIAAAAIIATGAAQGAIVASEPAPSFHLGGTPSGSTAAAQPDVVQASILANEEVVTLEEGRRRRQGGGNTPMLVKMGHEVLERGTEMQLNNPQSRMASKFREGTNPGRGSYRGK